MLDFPVRFSDLATSGLSSLATKTAAVDTKKGRLQQHKPRCQTSSRHNGQENMDRLRQTRLGQVASG